METIQETFSLVVNTDSIGIEVKWLVVLVGVLIRIVYLKLKGLKSCGKKS